MQKLIGGLGRQIDTGSPPPGSTYGGAYWTEEAERRDRERKALRAGSIPVPAAALAANKQIDEITRANLLVDWLADKDNFHHMTLNTPGFARMSADQQLREIEGLMEEVKEATSHAIHVAICTICKHLQSTHTVYIDPSVGKWRPE